MRRSRSSVEGIQIDGKRFSTCSFSNNAASRRSCFCSEALSLAGYIHAVSGEKAKAEAKIQQLLQQKAKRYVPPYSVALVFAGLRETETALQWLEQAFEDRDVHMPFLLDHKWNGLRSNEQFRQILSRVGFSIPGKARS